MELIKRPAREIVKLLRRGEISVGDCVDALSRRIAEVEPSINALPTLCFDRVDRNPDRTTLLAGLPVAIKDLNDVAGVPTSSGSKVNAGFIPHQSDLTVQTLEANGANVYAKSNTPEFGSGGNTFNDVFGATRNPYDISRSAGGSSGGAAAALASGTAWLAQGSDLAGSLRTPASFCGVTSLRPSPGLIAQEPGLQPFEVYAQQGPMARDIEDLALFADAMSGASSSAGLCKASEFKHFQNAAARPQKPVKIAFSDDLSICQTSEEVTRVCRKLVA
ncbi:MAG: amidase, partial [Gammaproteobacteria bacterium]